MTHRQTSRKKQSPATEASDQPYQPPQRLLDRCPGCGCMVLHGLAKPGGKIERLDPVQFPFSGDPHDCEKALILEQAMRAIQEGK